MSCDLCAQLVQVQSVKFRGSGESSAWTKEETFKLALQPFNAAPQQLPIGIFERKCAEWRRGLRVGLGSYEDELQVNVNVNVNAQSGGEG